MLRFGKGAQIVHLWNFSMNAGLHFFLVRQAVGKRRYYWLLQESLINLSMLVFQKTIVDKLKSNTLPGNKFSFLKKFKILYTLI